jgi:hypothetical protein
MSDETVASMNRDVEENSEFYEALATDEHE